MVNLKKILSALLCIFLPLFYSINVNAQCFNGTQYPSLAVTGPTVNSTAVQINTCNYAGEYARINGILNGASYTVFVNAATYVTVRSGSAGGPVVAMGFAPLTFTTTSTAALFVHFNTTAAPGCGTTPSGPCIVTSIALNSGGTTPAYNACATLLAAPACGNNITTVIASGTGAWNNYNTYAVPGKEYLYSYTAPVTGLYSITVTSISGGYSDFSYKAVGNCSAGGWNFILDFNGTGTSGTFSMTAGTQYYFLIDKESTSAGSVTWRVNCATPAFDPCASIATVTCGTAIATSIPSGNGAWDPGTCGYSTPGKEQLYSFTPTVTGAYSIQVNSVAGGYVDYFWKAASGGCNASGWNCIDDINFTGAFPVGTLTAGVQYYFLLDPEGTGAYTHNWTINCITPPYDPCSGISAAACGSANNTVIASGTGSFDGYGIFSTPGKEYIYTYTPTVTGNYTFTVNSSSVASWIEVFMKASSGGCNATGWTFIGDFSGPGTTPAFAMTAGIQYYIMIDPEYTTGSTINWTLKGTTATTPTITATPATTCGGSTTLSITSGTLNNNTTWSWYSGSCGGTAAGTGTSITVAPGAATTYFVRGTGGCADNGACGQVTVNVNTAPAITGQPSGANLCAGSPLNLSVTASNAAGYQWYRNSVAIPGATSATYNVPSTTTANAGSYYAVALANAPCANATSNTVTVNITDPATINTQPPANVGVCQGGTLTLAVTATGATSYQWYKDLSPILGANSATYSVAGATSANTGTYYLVMGSNSPCGSVQSGNYVVTITPNPTITTQPPTSVSACAGSPLNITVTAANAASYQWYLAGSPIGGATAAAYNVPSSSSANQGIYHVVAIGNNGCGTVTSNNSFVTITQPATITGQPAATTNLCAGSPLNLSVTANNAAGYQWYRNGALIPGATAATYSVGSVTTGNAGTYYVVVTGNSPCANATSGNAVVNVTTPASITTPPPATITVCNGSSLTISVSGANTTGYQWYKNNILIPGATSATYSVAATTMASAGTYHVVLGSNSPCAPLTSSNTIVTINPRPTAVITTNSPATICNGAFASMSVAFTGTGPWTFTRYNGTSSVTETVSNNPYVFFFTPSVTTTYSITGLSDINCTAISADYAGTATVNVNPRPTALISVNGPSTVCNGTAANMSIALTGTAPWTFNYSNGITSTQVTTFDNPYTFTVTPSVTSTYSINVLLDANCIANSADYAGSATVTVNPRPTAVLGVIGSPTVCNGGATTMQVAFTGTAPWTFNYNDGTTTTNVTTSVNPYTFIVSPQNTTTYTITSLVDANCTGLPVDYAGPKTVNVNARPTATISMNGPSTVCDGTSTNINVALTGTGPWTFSYYDGTTTSVVTTATSPYLLSVSPSVTSTYSVTALLDDNCTAIPSDYAGSVTVNVHTRPTAAVVVTGATTVCDGTGTNMNIDLTGTGPWLLQYSDGNTTTTVGTATNPYSFTVAPSATTTYSVITLVDANCDALPADMITTGTVNVNPRPTATIAANSATTICDGSTVDMDVTFTGTGPWTFDYFDGTATTNVTAATSPYSFTTAPNVTTTYSITSLVDANCTGQVSDYAATELVAVNHAPTIITQPQSVTECSGIGTSLSVAATGAGLTYQWTKDGLNINDGPTYNGTNTSMLVINSITGASGSYEVIIGGTCPPSVTSTAVTVTENVNNEWSGAIDQMWSIAGNWSCGTVPIVTTDVLIPGSAVLQPLVDIPTAICNTINIEPLASVSFTGVNNALEIKSTITNDGTFDATIGKVILSGTGAQNIPAIVYKDLEIEGGSTKSLDGPATITGILSLMDGYISLGEYDLTLDVPVQTMGGSATSFIITTDTGAVVGKNMGAVGGNPDQVMFHVGTEASSYTPIMLENLGDADDYRVRVMRHVYIDGYGVNPLMVINPVVDKTWMVTEGVAGGSIVRMNPYWNIPEEVNGFDQSHVYVAHYIGGEWTGLTDSASGAPAAGISGGMFYADADSIQSFSPFTVASIHEFPLSIKLRDIAALNVGTRNRIDWSSASEDAGDVYHLERSVDGKTFTHIADINAKGEAAEYTYWDETPVIGKNYYRLRMANTDGRIYYSKVVSATVKASESAFSITVYPNPVQHSVSVAVNGNISGKGSVAVTDMSGRVVKAARQITGHSVYINMEDVAQGMYFIKYSDDVHNETIKVNKQ